MTSTKAKDFIPLCMDYYHEIESPMEVDNYPARKTTDYYPTKEGPKDYRSAMEKEATQPIETLHQAENKDEFNFAELEQQLALILSRVSKLYDFKETMTAECFTHVNALYGMSKNALNIVKSGNTCIPNFHFLKYIHQCVLFDYVYDEMGHTVGETPEYYKLKAKKRLTLSDLRDILTKALKEAKLIVKPVDIRQYLNINFYNPPWSTLTYKDENLIYHKLKSQIYKDRKH